MRHVFWSLLLLGCGSENKVGDDLDPGPHTTSSPETTPGTDVPEQDTAGGPDTDTDDPPTGDPDTGTVPPDLTEQEICEQAAALAISLDPYQVAGDGRVIYCHSGSGNTYNYIETDISSCLPHLNHTNDVFPTSGCDS